MLEASRRWDDAEVARDRELLARHGRGDPEAFAELYAAHYRRLVWFCFDSVRDHHVAEEIAQDAFVRAFQAMDRLRDDTTFYPWLRVIARRLVIDNYRRSGRTMSVPDVQVVEPLTAEDVLVEQADVELLALALRRVRPRHRLVLELREVEGLSYEDIALKLDVPTTAVATLLHRARLALRREYVALTEQERVGAVAAVLVALVAATRRARDRVMQTLSGLPDTSGLTAPLAGIALGVTVGMSQLSTPPAIVSSGSDNDAAGQAQRAAAQTADLALATTSPAREAAHGGDPIEDGVKTRRLVLASMAHDEESYQAMHERSRRMPIYYRFEPTGTDFSADPDAMKRDLTSTSEGDLSWYRPLCPDPTEPC